jgi:hypothetical protein
MKAARQNRKPVIVSLFLLPVDGRRIDASEKRFWGRAKQLR